MSNEKMKAFTTHFEPTNDSGGTIAVFYDPRVDVSIQVRLFPKPMYRLIENAADGIKPFGEWLMMGSSALSKAEPVQAVRLHREANEILRKGGFDCMPLEANELAKVVACGQTAMLDAIRKSSDSK